jgi:RNA polymerase sigma-70 factor, ECF subfamily
MSGVVQTTLWEAHRQLATWQSLDAEARVAWLRRLFLHNLLDEVRRFRTQRRDVLRERSLEQSLEQSASRLRDWLASDQTSPSQHAARSEQAVRLAQALAQLPSAQRDAIELHYLRGQTLADVAAQLGKTPGAVAALIFRGTSTLRSMLAAPGQASWGTRP